jgi:hypothetical protein
MTPQEIADSLTLQQRDAICGRYSWASPIEEEEGEAVLYRLGLWNPKPKYGECIITPLGLQVRRISIRNYLKGLPND